MAGRSARATLRYVDLSNVEGSAQPSVVETHQKPSQNITKRKNTRRKTRESVRRFPEAHTGVDVVVRDARALPPRGLAAALDATGFALAPVPVPEEDAPLDVLQRRDWGGPLLAQRTHFPVLHGR